MEVRSEIQLFQLTSLPLLTGMDDSVVPDLHETLSAFAFHELAYLALGMRLPEFCHAVLDDLRRRPGAEMYKLRKALERYVDRPTKSRLRLLRERVTLVHPTPALENLARQELWQTWARGPAEAIRVQREAWGSIGYWHGVGRF
jgi:hypothetical protein